MNIDIAIGPPVLPILIGGTGGPMVGPAKGVTMYDLPSSSEFPILGFITALQVAGVTHTIQDNHLVVFLGGDGDIYVAEQYFAVDDPSNVYTCNEIAVYKVGERPTLYTDVISGGSRSYPLPEGATENPLHSFYDPQTDTSTACEGSSVCKFCRRYE